MKFLRYQVNTNPGDHILVRLDKQANVILLDDCQFQNFKSRRRYSYYGGHAKASPVRLSPPRPGRWNVVVNLGGYAGSVRASCSVQRKS